MINSSDMVVFIDFVLRRAIFHRVSVVATGRGRRVAEEVARYRGKSGVFTGVPRGIIVMDGQEGTV